MNSLISVSHPSYFEHCTQLGSITKYYIVLQFYSKNQNYIAGASRPYVIPQFFVMKKMFEVDSWKKFLYRDKKKLIFGVESMTIALTK